MLLWGILGALLAGGAVTVVLLIKARQRCGAPLYVQVEEDAENLEWLLLALLRKAPQHQLLIIDRSRGENRLILRALSRQYHLFLAEEAPPGTPVLYVRSGVSVCGLLAQYERSQYGAMAQARES